MKLYKHQEDIITENKPRAGLFLGTGAGKSRIGILLARGKTLVIAPKTQVLDGNWQREFDKIYAVEGTSVTSSNFTVISKETFRRDHAKLPSYDTVIVDEAHTVLGVTPNVRYRNKQAIPKASQLFEALESYLQRTSPSRFYLCTATIIRSPMTVWAAGKLLGYKWNFYEFRQMFYVRLPMPGREVWSPKSDKVTKDKLGSLVRKIGYTGRIEDYVDMPPQIFRTDFVELTVEQKNKIKELALEYPDPLVRSLKTHMLENGVLSGDEFSEPKFFDNAKIERILELAIEFPRMVIFARYTEQIRQIARALDEAGKRAILLTGATKDRGEAIRKANEATECVFIAQTQISAGFELPEYPVMVFASLDFSVVNLVQAQGRISRINHPKRNLYIYLVCRDSVDKKVYESVVHNKMDFHLAQFAKVRYN